MNFCFVAPPDFVGCFFVFCFSFFLDFFGFGFVCLFVCVDIWFSILFPFVLFLQHSVGDS